MRVECKHYESRTYRSGETVRMCRLDLAPEAPWRCPEACPRFERRLADAGWHHGSLVAPPPPPEPPGLGPAAAALLDEAEDIVNRAGPGIVADVSRTRQATKAPSLWRRVTRRLRRR